MAANKLSLSFDKLRGQENFDVWKRRAKSYLVLKGCWQMIDAGLGETPTANDLEKTNTLWPK